MEPTRQELKHAPRMRLHFNVHDPVELVEMTLAFQGLGFEYQSFLKSRFLESETRANSAEVKLYITRIESNCILAELAPALPLLGVLAPVLADVNTVHDFVVNTSNTIKWLVGLAKKKNVSSDDIPYSKRRIGHLRDVVRLVAKNHDSSLGLAAIKYEESSGQDRAVLEMHFSDKECRQAELGATKALIALDVREKADREKVLMYFHQTNIEDPKSGGRTGDKAVISSISPEPLSVYIIPETDQQKVRYVLDDKEHNPLYTGFVVDVNIENDRNGRPKIYRVIRIHDIVYDEPGT
jgi:hypothetical protein